MDIIAVLVVLILILGCVVIIGCFVGKKRKVEHQQDVVLEGYNMNGTDKSSIELNSLEPKKACKHQKSQFDTKAVIPPGEITITDDGACYAEIGRSSCGVAHCEESPDFDEAGYSCVTILASHPEPSKHDGSLQTKEPVYSVIIKTGSPVVPPKTPELYLDLQMETEKAKQAVEMKNECSTDENLKNYLLARARSSSVGRENLEEHIVKTSLSSTLIGGSPLEDHISKLGGNKNNTLQQKKVACSEDARSEAEDKQHRCGRHSV